MRKKKIITHTHILCMWSCQLVDYTYVSMVTGSTQLQRGLTQQTGGSLLDDSQWHDVIVRRNHTKVTLVVDRLETHFETNGLFYRLNLDKKVSCYRATSCL